MDNPQTSLPESESSSDAYLDQPPEPQPDIRQQFFPEYQPKPEAEPTGYVNERIQHAYDRLRTGFGKAKERYQASPRLQKVTYQGKFLPAFWTVACIFSLLVNIVLISVLISFGHHFFELKNQVSKGLVSGLSENLALLDKAHIVTNVPFSTTVPIQDNLPVAFNLAIKQNTQVVLAEDTAVDGSTYINLAPVPLNITLPAGTPIQVNFDMSIPVSQTVPVDLSVPVKLLVPIDVPIDETDLHQSIVGLQSAIAPYKGLMDSTFNSPKDISLCNHWWAGWLCNIFFGKP